MLGFADHHLPEQQYVIQIDKKDLDLQLKYAADQGWGLYNVQTKEWKGPGVGVADTIQVMEVKKDDAFSRLRSLSLGGSLAASLLILRNYSPPAAL